MKPIDFPLILGMALTLWASAPASAQPAQRPGASPASAFDHAMDRLPKPQTAAGELPRPCAKSVAEIPKPEYASPEVRARMVGDAQLRGVLGRWGALHFGITEPMCSNTPYLVRKLQEATAEPPTGVLTMRDVDRLAAALGGGRQDQQAAAARAADALEKSLEQKWRTGVTLFDIELGALLPDLPGCIFTLADQPTCLNGDPARGPINLYFAVREKPAILAGAGVTLGTRRVPLGDGAVQWRVVTLGFETTGAALPQFEAKFGPARTGTQSWQNELGAKWQSQSYAWRPKPDVRVSISCGVEFGGGCNASAGLDVQAIEPAPAKPQGRKL